MPPSYVNQSVTFEVQVARETGTLADDVPTLVVENDAGVVLFTYTGATDPAVTSLGDGKYQLVTSFAAQGEYYFTWSWALGGVPLSDSGSITVCLPTSSTGTGRTPAGFSTLSGTLATFDGQPVPFLAVKFSIDASDHRPYVSRASLLSGDVNAVSDRDGSFSVKLPRGARMQVRFPHIDKTYSFVVPEVLKADLFDYLFPHPVSLRWVEWDAVGGVYIPVVLNVSDERVVDGTGVRIAVEAVWSDGTCTVLPPDLSASATMGSLTEDLLTDSVEYELAVTTAAEVEHIPDDELWVLAGYEGSASFMPIPHELDYLDPLSLVRA